MIRVVYRNCTGWVYDVARVRQMEQFMLNEFDTEINFEILLKINLTF